MIKNFLLVIISTLLSLFIVAVIFELVASYRYDAWREAFVEKGGLYGALTVASENNVLIWEYRPEAVGNTWNSTISTNSLGFRDRNWKLAKRPGSERIVFAGDSVTLGLGVTVEETFVRLVEQLAQTGESPVNIETMSFAVGGYSALQVAEMIRDKAVPFSPDIIIYVMCMNDFDFVHSSGQIMKYFRKPENFLLRFLERTYAKFFVDHYYDYHFQKNKDAIFADISSLNSELDDLGIEFIVAMMPIFDGEDAESNYPVAAMHQEILERLRAENVGVIDLLGTFDNRAAPRSSFAFDDVHLTAEGHRLAAEKLVRYLTDDRLLK
jgi:lysophospholipase L1-like esterase